MEIWSLKECDSVVAVGQRYSEVEDDYNFQNTKPLKSLYLSPLPRLSQATSCLTEGTRSSVLTTCMRLIPTFSSVLQFIIHQ